MPPCSGVLFSAGGHGRSVRSGAVCCDERDEQQGRQPNGGTAPMSALPGRRGSSGAHTRRAWHSGGSRWPSTGRVRADVMHQRSPVARTGPCPPRRAKRREARRTSFISADYAIRTRDLCWSIWTRAGQAQGSESTGAASSRPALARPRDRERIDIRVRPVEKRKGES